MAAICIVFVLVFALVTYVPQVIDWARQTSDRQTLTVLNDALSRYKTEGGSVGGLNRWTPISSVLSSLQTAVTWGGYGHQFLHNGITYVGRSISATGTGAQYRFTRYNYYTAEPGVSASDLGPNGGLVGWWKFDEGSGAAAADSSGGGHSTSISGTSIWATGHGGGGYALDTTNCTGGASSLPSGMTSITISGWFYRTGPGYQYSYLEVGNYSTNAFQIQLRGARTTSYSSIVLNNAKPSGGEIYIEPMFSIIPLNTWVFLAGTISSDGIAKAYCNGSLLQSGNIGSAGSTVSPIFAFSNFPGLIDDVRIYNRALSADEVAQLYAGH